MVISHLILPARPFISGLGKFDGCGLLLIGQMTHNRGWVLVCVRGGGCGVSGLKDLVALHGSDI